MDSIWRSELYMPSSACEREPYQLLENEDLHRMIAELASCTKKIKNFPYDAELWQKRSYLLRSLGYPELALGDTYKARLLIDAAFEEQYVLRTYTHLPIITNLTDLVNNALEGRTTLGEKSFLTLSMKMYYNHTVKPYFKKWAAKVATPSGLEKVTLHAIRKLEAEIWSDLMVGLEETNACRDYVELSRQAAAKFGDHPGYRWEYRNAQKWSEERKKLLEEQVEDGEMSPETMSTTLSNGGVYPVPYPWMTDELLIRDDDFLTKIQEEFKKVSSNCMVIRSTIRDVKFENGVASENQFDVLGVVATRNIKANETTLVDKTIGCVLSTTTRCPTCCGPMPAEHRKNARNTNSCCGKTYCSQTCAKTALTEFHRAECGQEEYIEEYYTEASKATETTDYSLEHILLIRIIANSLTEKATHPLKTSFLRRFTPSYSTDHLTIFNWTDHIVTPTNLLMALNIDVFKDLDYDTWVLHTIRHRIQNNKHGVVYSRDRSSKSKSRSSASKRENREKEIKPNNIVGSSLSPLYSMHNHSCAPNITWEFTNGEGYDGNPEVDGRCSTLRMFANRDIERGEELCITYILPLDIGREERNDRLVCWLGGECRCLRCLVEMEEEDEGAGV